MLDCSSDLSYPTSIVSAIEFDNDAECFAIAGTSKCIKIYDFHSIMRNTVDMHYPLMYLSCTSKVSCVSWNSFFKVSCCTFSPFSVIMLSPS